MYIFDIFQSSLADPSFLSWEKFSLDILALSGGETIERRNFMAKTCFGASEENWALLANTFSVVWTSPVSFMLHVSRRVDRVAHRIYFSVWCGHIDADTEPYSHEWDPRWYDYEASRDLNEDCLRKVRCLNQAQMLFIESKSGKDHHLSHCSTIAT